MPGLFSFNNFIYGIKKYVILLHICKEATDPPIYLSLLIRLRQRLPRHLVGAAETKTSSSNAICCSFIVTTGTTR